MVLCTVTGLVSCSKNLTRENSRIKGIRLVFWSLSVKAKKQEILGVTNTMESRRAHRKVTYIITGNVSRIFVGGLT